ncbi:HNH endonuclease signature motif containing protein [uncultured Herbaspirillum sp.]|uniref:HNH endonuclease n=1 Tax=uncultured Herbaspirillum sp. TaxID=160236 RepID=UPI00258C6B8A|nr:HNH endonuclease signature motif containing protein [uncultured Herbaspirillum sp.]
MKEQKYSALARYLAELPAEFISMSFSEIEAIIGASLPKSAHKHQTWWSNATVGSHNWAHLWQSAGWRQESVNFARQEVCFRREGSSALSTLTSLAPQQRETIYDLLNVAGVSTKKWHQKENGDVAGAIKANGRYCYNWSFGSVHEKYVLCLWHDDLRIKGNEIVTSENMRELRDFLREDARNVDTTESQRIRGLIQASRAEEFDRAVKESYERRMPISVIIARGDRHDRELQGEGSSHVQFRALDPIPWYVHNYNEDTGQYLLIRGSEPRGLLDSVSSTENDTDTWKNDALGLVKLRQGQTEFRNKLLAAYRRQCAVTKCRVEGILEAAHIRSHSEVVNYDVTNGLLLRADIHTLFDLKLLFIDSQLKVRLKPELLASEYKQFEGREIVHPHSPSEMPNRDALQARFKDFAKRGL